MCLGVSLVLVRAHITQIVSLLMVLPVLLVALAGGARLGSLAAVSAAATFGILHTEPYGHLTIADPDDIVETVVLLLIGVVMGFLAEAAQRAVAAARLRRDELAAVTDVIGRMGAGQRGEELVDSAATCLGTLLRAREVTWREGYRGTAGPVLLPDGSLAVGASDAGDLGAATLPPTIEIPVGTPPVELGRFVVRTSVAGIVSREERRAASAVAGLLARVLQH